MGSSPISLPSAKIWNCACVVVTDPRMLAASAATAAAAAKSASAPNNCPPTTASPNIPFCLRLLDRHVPPPSPKHIPYNSYAGSTDSNCALLNSPFSCIILPLRHISPPIDYLEECAKFNCMHGSCPVLLHGLALSAIFSIYP